MTIINPITVAACGGASIFLMVASSLPTKNPLTARIKKLAPAKPIKPVEIRFKLVDQVVSKKRRSKTQQSLNEAGWYDLTPAAMTMRTIGTIGLGSAAGLGLFLVLNSTLYGTLLGAFTALVAWRLPSITLARAIKARKVTIARDLPDFLDLLSTTVEAGLALNAAMIQAADATTGPLCEELNATLGEIRLGRSRSESLTAMADRINEPTVTTMVTAIVQAEKLGSNLSLVLKDLAKDTRERRWVVAEEKAAKLPVLMLIPMALFMIPSLYIMIFGPVAAVLIQSLHP